MAMNPDRRFPYEGASAATLRRLAAALRSGQLAAPVTRLALSMTAPCPEPLSVELQRLSDEGMSPTHLALLLDAAADTANAKLAAESNFELVWTGPESTVSRSRDTAVVVAELFSLAVRSVLVSTFVIRDGQRVLAPLAARLDEIPGLTARLFVHVGRSWKDTRDESEILREFADRLAGEWPGARRPEVFYDPRTLSSDEQTRASWHAKCVLVDDEISFVTSANFTEWAQQRNVEAGVLVRSRHFTHQLRAQFDALVQTRAVRRLPGF